MYFLIIFVHGLYFFIIAGPNSDGVIRLFNGYNVSLHNTAGRVQVWYGGKWGSICRDSLFNYAAADVICNQLGWDGAADYSSAEYDGYIIIIITQ